jgi:deoxyribonuclease-1
MRRRVVAAAALLAALCWLGAAAAREPALSGNARVRSFAEAKRRLRKIYQGHARTLYCGCRYQEDGKVDLGSCGYVPVRSDKRARRMEWEHVVPAEAFGRSFAAWREGHAKCVDRRGRAFRGRRCARKVSGEFRRMEADMYNLYPAIGELNGLRSNYSMAMIDGEQRTYGQCDVEIAGRKFEPRPEVRGDIARTYQYMHRVYPGRGVVSDKNDKLFAAWAAADPVDAWECERARLIEQAQGNVNEVVASACRARGLGG